MSKRRGCDCVLSSQLEEDVSAESAQIRRARKSKIHGGFPDYKASVVIANTMPGDRVRYSFHLWNPVVVIVPCFAVFDGIFDCSVLSRERQ